MSKILTFSPSTTLFLTLMFGGGLISLTRSYAFIALMFGVLYVLQAVFRKQGENHAFFLMLLTVVALAQAGLLRTMSQDAQESASLCAEECLIDLEIDSSDPLRGRCQKLTIGNLEWSCNLALRLTRSSNFVPGTRYRVRGAIRPTSADPDARYYLKSFHSVRVGDESAWGLWLSKTRHSLRRVVDDAVDEKHRGVLWALLSGSKEWMLPSDRDRWSSAGMVHLIAISGMHLGSFVILLRFLTRLVCASNYGPWWVRRGISLLSLVFMFANIGFLLSWWHAPPSAIRSAGMWSVALLTDKVALRFRTFDALGTSGVVIVLFDPMMCRDLGFQLSSLAVLGLLWAQDSGRDGLWGVATSLRSSAAATLFTAPLTGPLFGLIPIMGIPINVIAAPLVLFILAPILAALLCGSMLGVTALESILLCLHAVTEVLDSLARFGARWSVAIDFGPKHALLTVFGMVVLGMKSRLYSYVLPTLAIGALALTSSDLVVSPRVDALDVGQGDATLIRSSTGFHMLFDTGGRLDAPWGEDGYSRVVTELRTLGVDRLDVVILSHPDPDHTGALEAVLRSFEVDRLVLDYYPSNDSRLKRSIDAWCSVALACDLELSSTMVWTLEDLRVTLYRADPIEGVTLFDNERSSSLLVQVEGAGILMTGDLPQWRELELLQKLPPGIEVLKLGHHGSRTSSASEFIRALNPAIVWSSHGFLNRFGHPHREVLHKVKLSGARYVTTAESGSICFEWKSGRWHLGTP